MPSRAPRLMIEPCAVLGMPQRTCRTCERTVDVNDMCCRRHHRSGNVYLTQNCNECVKRMVRARQERHFAARALAQQVARGEIELVENEKLDLS